jgi:hypothetical protein
MEKNEKYGMQEPADFNERLKDPLDRKNNPGYHSSGPRVIRPDSDLQEKFGTGANPEKGYSILPETPDKEPVDYSKVRPGLANK